MDRLTRAVAALLRLTVRLLPDARRAWGEAVWAEAGEVPAGWTRLRWLVGGWSMVAREADVIRRIGYPVAAIAAGIVLVRLDWHPGSANPAMPTNRIGLIVAVLVLAVLPSAARPLLGPTADNRVARAVRGGGYLAVYALVLVLVGLSRFAGSRFDHFRAFDQANWEADMRSGAVVSAVLIVAMLGSYAAAILIVTSKRMSVEPVVLATGAGIGVAVAVFMYALMPLGNARPPSNGLLATGYGAVLILVPLAAPLLVGPLVAGRVAARPAGPATRSSAAQPTATGARSLRAGIVGGLCVGGTAALLLAILTVTTMLLLPRHVHLVWGNPDPNVPHGTLGEVQMSVGDAAIRYQVGLILGPLLGLVLGALGGGIGVRRSGTPRPGTPRTDRAEFAATP